MKTMPLYFCCFTPYDDKFKGLHILFDKENVRETLGEVVSRGRGRGSSALPRPRNTHTSHSSSTEEGRLRSRTRTGYL